MAAHCAVVHECTWYPQQGLLQQLNIDCFQIHVYAMVILSLLESVAGLWVLCGSGSTCSTVPAAMGGMHYDADKAASKQMAAIGVHRGLTLRAQPACQRLPLNPCRIALPA